MLIEMFMNELSLVPTAVDVSTGQERVKQLVLTMRAATAQGIRRTLHLPQNFDQNPIAPHYYWKNWLSDRHVDYDLQRFFKSLATKSPFLRDEPDIEDAWAGIDCFWQSEPALGLKAAYVTDGLAISISSRPAWNSHSIQCEIQEIVDDNNISCHNEEIHHASSSTHLNPQIMWIQQRIRNAVEDGRELWNRVGEIFPLLIFSPIVEDQMGNLPHLSLGSIMRGLSSLNAFCMRWQSGAFDRTKIGCFVSPESQPTLQKYKSAHTFLCPDGQKRLFNLHAKVGKWRIYFTYDLGPGQLLVGHVGKHLPTVKFSR